MEKEINQPYVAFKNLNKKKEEEIKIVDSDGSDSDLKEEAERYYKKIMGKSLSSGTKTSEQPIKISSLLKKN